MAWNNNYGNRGRGYYGGGRKNYNKRKHNKTEEFAFQLARVEIGLKNPESRVTQSYVNGQNSTINQGKKPLF